MLFTERLQFRNWGENDEENAFKLWGDTKVSEFIFSGSLTRADTKQILTKHIHTQALHGMQYWPIELRIGKDFVGCCGLRPWKYTSEKNSAELGFHICPEHWRKGYAQEAAQEAIRYGFTELKLDSILAGHHPKNAASAKLLEKLGFRLEGHVLYPPTGKQHPYYRLVKPLEVSAVIPR